LKSAPSVRLGPNTDGIDPCTSASREGRGFTIDLPAGSFVERRILFKKVYVFEDIAAHVKAVITPLFGSGFRYCSSARARM